MCVCVVCMCMKVKGCVEEGGAHVEFQLELLVHFWKQFIVKKGAQFIT